MGCVPGRGRRSHGPDDHRGGADAPASLPERIGAARNAPVRRRWAESARRGPSDFYRPANATAMGGRGREDRGMQGSAGAGARMPSLERTGTDHPDRSMHILEITVSVISLLTAILLAATR